MAITRKLIIKLDRSPSAEVHFPPLKNFRSTDFEDIPINHSLTKCTTCTNEEFSFSIFSHC